MYTKHLLLLLVLLNVNQLSFAQKPTSLQFVDTKLSASQFIITKFVDTHSNLLDSVCTWAYSSIKFTVQTDGHLIDIVPSVGVPNCLKMPLVEAVSHSEGKWRNSTNRSISCILPLIIVPACRCADESKNPFRILQSGAQMLKYEGDYVIFGNNAQDFYNYSVDMAEGVTLSPLLLRACRVN